MDLINITLKLVLLSSKLWFYDSKVSSYCCFKNDRNKIEKILIMNFFTLKHIFLIWSIHTENLTMHIYMTLTVDKKSWTRTRSIINTWIQIEETFRIVPNLLINWDGTTYMLCIVLFIYYLGGSTSAHHGVNN